MKDFVHGKNNVEFRTVTGEVLGSDKYSETQISSSGGGGYVSTHGGHVSAPRIHSSSVTNHEFWIKTEDGLEKDVQLRGVDIPLRPGQKITLISAGRKGAEKAWYSVLVNHSAGRYWFINNADSLNKKLKLELMTGKSLLVAGAIFGGLLYLLDRFPQYTGALIYYVQRELGFAGIVDLHDVAVTIVWGVPLTYVIFRFCTKLFRVNRLRKRLRKHLEGLALQTLDTDQATQ